MPKSPTPLAALSFSTLLRATPTDVSQFVRLEQCERFLRLRLAERAGHKFMEPYDVTVQRITPLMTLSGHTFEDAIEQELGGRFRSVHYAVKYGGAHDSPANHKDVLAQARGLITGEAVLLFQTRLEVTLWDWLLRGDVDLIKLSRSADGALDVLIADMKSTAEVKVEHRLQVAFYCLMLTALFDAEGVTAESRRTGILFRPFRRSDAGGGVRGRPAPRRGADRVRAKRLPARTGGRPGRLRPLGPRLSAGAGFDRPAGRRD